jgi:hypothetical protein
LKNFESELLKQKLVFALIKEASDEKNVKKNYDEIALKIKDKKDWGHAYIGPYDSTQTYDAIVRAQGVQTVMPDSWHFGTDAHAAWFRFVLKYGIKHQLWL